MKKCENDNIIFTSPFFQIKNCNAIYLILRSGEKLSYKRLLKFNFIFNQNKQRNYF